MVKYIVLGVLALFILGIAINFYANPTYSAYKKAVKRNENKLSHLEPTLVTEEDLQHLPEPIIKYLNYVGVVGNPKVGKFYAEMSGKMKLDPDKEWSNVTVEQTSYTEDVARMFYISMNYNGVTVRALHHYEDYMASMVIKILDLVKVGDARGEKMSSGETVTVFNDMCIFAPMTLIDERISWEAIDDYNAKGTFHNGDISVSAVLTIDEEGKLIDFYSEDRYQSKTGAEYELVPWSTPISEYTEVQNMKMPKRVQAVWHQEDGDFIYADFTIDKLYFNN